MLYLLPSLLHEARFPSSEEQKKLQMEAWGGMHLPSAVPGQSETTNEKCSGNENDEKDKTLYGKERTASLPKRQQKGLHCTETEALRVG